MISLREFEERVVANGRVDSSELRTLQSLLSADRKIDRTEADWLVELHKRVAHRSDAFERFFYNTLKNHILADGRITAEETDWLRQLIFFDNKVEDEERKFLTELKGEARELSPEFQAFLQEAMKRPPEQHTSG